MKKYIQNLYHDTIIGHFMLSPIKKLYDIFVFRIMPEKMFLKRTFKILLGYNLNLENPRTLNEKLQWLKLNDRTPLHTLCADKYAVRNYVKEKIGDQYLIPLVLHTDNPAEINSDNLPDYPFIIKTNHGYGGHIIVKDKSKIEWAIIRKNLKKLLKRNHYYVFREWPYKNIEPSIIVEKLILDQNNNIPFDYKFNCFNGKLGFPEVHFDRFINRKKNIYDSAWNISDIRWGAKRGGEIKKPKMLNKMILLAEILAKDFRFIRVDFYNIGSKIYFGELTHTPGAGFTPFKPFEWDKIFGEKLKL